MKDGDGNWDDINFFKDIKNLKDNSMRREALENDRRLQDLVTYELTEGLTVALKNVTDILPKFAEYKMRVKKGCFTIEQLEEKVLSKYAIITKKEDELDWVEFSDTEPEKNYILENNNE